MDKQVTTIIDQGIGILQWHPPKSTNPISKQLEIEIISALDRLDSNDDVKVILLTGGEGRSFSAGGDFNEVRMLKGGEDVEKWIDRVFNLYHSILKVKKLTIAAIDSYAIGIGFQMALSCDIRIATEKAKFIMPELKHGISCTIGQFMLDRALTRSSMQIITYGCEEISGKEAIRLGLAHEIIDDDNIVKSAIEYAKRYVSYPLTPLQSTKGASNKRYIEELNSVIEVSKEVHRKAFAIKSAKSHFDNILKTSTIDNNQKEIA